MMKCVWFRLARPEPRRWKLRGWRRRAQVTRLRSSTSLWRRSLSASAACCSNDCATEAAGTRTRDGPSSIIRSVTSASMLLKKSRLEASRTHRWRSGSKRMPGYQEKSTGTPNTFGTWRIGPEDDFSERKKRVSSLKKCGAKYLKWRECDCGYKRTLSDCWESEKWNGNRTISRTRCQRSFVCFNHEEI